MLLNCLLRREKNMKIKHWQGYGVVDAKNVSKKKNDDGSTSIHIKVTGNHEYGIHTEYPWNIAEWLLAKFDKAVKDDRCLLSFRVEDGDDVDVNGVPTNTCDYYITYKVGE